MATPNPNPFVLPGLGQSGEMAANPLLASMEMMRKAWEGMAGAETPLAGAPLSAEDLERRIADLKTVENWLRMNLSMLGGTIQALEVQRATIATLKAFVASAGQMAAGPAAGSTVSGDSSGLFSPQAQGAAPVESQAEAEPEPGAPAPAHPAESAMHAWWDMLQSQFDHIAAATSATLQAGLPEPAAPASEKPAARKSAARKAAGKKAATKTTTARKAAKKAAKKAAGGRKPAASAS